MYFRIPSLTVILYNGWIKNVARAGTPARRPPFSKTTNSLLTDRGIWTHGIHLALGPWRYLYQTVRSGPHYQTTRRLVLISEIGVFLHFFSTTRLHGGDHPDDGSFFSFENLLFSIILFCTYYTLALTAT